MNKDRLSTQSTAASSSTIVSESEFKIDDIIEKLISVRT